MTEIRALIAQAVEMLGSENKLAKAAGVAQSTMNASRRRGGVGPKVARGIEKATGGRISKSALRPDIWPEEKE